MNFRLPTANSQKETTKTTKVTKKVLISGSFVLFVSFVVNPSAQQLLDRVVARVGTVAITQTDIDSAVAFGIVEAKAADGRDPVKQMIDRRLILAEVSRFPPPEPTEDAVNEQLAKM